MSPLLITLTDSIKAGKRKLAVEGTQAALSEELPPREILASLIAGMNDVGRRFKANEIFVPEVLIAARAMKESMRLLEPVLIEAGIEPDYTAIIGTVEGDLHDIGKNLVGMMWKGANFKVIDLGINVPASRFAEAAQEHNAHIVGLSALLTTTMDAMAESVAAIIAAKLPNTKVMIGGAPITQEFSDSIGAHGFAPDAASAVDIARLFVGEN
jgi:5-methyltetrahydrofolate--homocysteine methyltransferase